VSFTEASTVENLIRDLLCGGVTHHTAVGAGLARKSGKLVGLGWHYLAPTNIPRQPHEVLVEDWIREALIRLNPEIAAVPDRADEVLYKLRAIVIAVRSDGLLKANEELTAWLRGDRSMPFGPNHEHTSTHLIDFDRPENNHYVVTQQFTFRAGPAERRADLVLLVNGFPLVLIEAKTPVRPSVSWVDGATDIHVEYERDVPELFVANVFSVATEGKELMYGAARMPVNLWGPWRGDDEAAAGTLAGLKAAVNPVRDDLETLVVDAELLEAIMGSSDPTKRAKEFETKLIARLRKHMGNLRYRKLSERLEALKDRHERGLLNSVEFLKQLLELARDLVVTEKEMPPEEDVDLGKAALTELFQQVKNPNTPVVVERIVADIDEIVRLVRFPGWQQTASGEREVKKALRRSLLKYQLHQDVELFERAYGYVKQYY